MALKFFTGNNDGDLNNALNFAPISLRNSSFQWSASGTGTDEYYVEAAGGGDPGLVEPDVVLSDGSQMTKGTIGSLSAGEWGWGNNDTLGFNTIYVRLSDGADPDSKLVDYVEYQDVLQAGDDFEIGTGSGQIDSGLNQSDIEIASFVGRDVSSVIASREESLKLDVANGGAVLLESSADAYLDLLDSNVSPQFSGRGDVILEGSNLSKIFLIGGKLICNGVTATDLEQEDGRATIDRDCSITDVLSLGGTTVLNQTSTTTNVKAHGGSVDMLQSRESRTVTNMEVRNGGSVQYDSDVVTLTNSPTGRVELNAA